MPDTPLINPINAAEVISRAEHARQIITGFSLAMPTLADLCIEVNNGLADIPILISEIARLRDMLTACRIDRANLAAAGRATIAADVGGESDPLAYLRDELLAQGFSAGRGDR